MSNYTRGEYKKVERFCIVCGASFQGNKKALFDKNNCKQKYFSDKRKAEKNK